jgi:PTH1 family peptidyl-tRNA hydrolase
VAAKVLVVGLGNPGIEYQFTPHNAGFLAIDRIAERCGAVVSNRRGRAVTGKAMYAGKEILLAKPETYMNLSGAAVRALLDEAGEQEEDESRGGPRLIVLYDDVDFSLGTIRVKERGSSAGHNGVKSISGSLGTEEWTRVRIGIAPEDEKAAETARRQRKDYVLKQLRNSELKLLDQGLEKAADAVETILRDGVAAAMNKFNRRDEEAAEEKV